MDRCRPLVGAGARRDPHHSTGDRDLHIDRKIQRIFSLLSRPRRRTAPRSRGVLVVGLGQPAGTRRHRSSIPAASSCSSTVTVASSSAGVPARSKTTVTHRFRARAGRYHLNHPRSRRGELANTVPCYLLRFAGRRRQLVSLGTFTSIGTYRGPRPTVRGSICLPVSSRRSSGAMERVNCQPTLGSTQ